MTVPAASPVTHLFHHPDARLLAERWRDRFELIECVAPPDRAGVHVWAADDRLTLCCNDGRRRETLCIGLAELERRAVRGGELSRACGVGAAAGPRVLDAMAGWGVDGLVLARRGCRVTMVECQPAVSALQQDLVRRSGAADVSSRLGDGFDALDDGAPWDVVYLDPMFARRGKAALPGKRMQWLARLAAADPRPLSFWLEHAAAAATDRVVVKRRRTDAPLAEPDWQIVGRSVRYDVYRGRGYS